LEEETNGGILIDMRNFLILCFVVIFLFGCSFNEKLVVEQSIGRLVVSHDEKFSYQYDQNHFGLAKLAGDFRDTYYKNIQQLEVKYRIQYFWAAMWHLGFSGGEMGAFQELVLTDCGDEFIQKLEGYVAKETELNRSKRRLQLSKRVLFGLKKLQQHQKDR